jgi:hypothetical protein
LIKLQSKHVAIYSRVAFSRDRYPVQVDDALDFLLDRDTWLRARDDANAIMRALIDDGVEPYPAKKSLERLVLPYGASVATAAHWTRLTDPLRIHHRANWWRLFCELIPTMEKTDATTRKRSDYRTTAERDEGNAPAAGVPAARDQEADQPRSHREKQVLLPGF